MSSKIIELRNENSWVLINKDNVRSVEFLRNEVPYADTFTIIILYIDRDEDEDYQLTLDHKYSEADCRDFTLKLQDP